MIEHLHWLAPLAVFAIVALFGFVGCVGDDPVVVAQKAKDEQQKADQAAQQAKQQAQLYENVVHAEAALVAYWRLSEGETGNNVAPDSGPQALNGTYPSLQAVTRSVGGALFVPEQDDKAAQFDGVHGYMEVAYNGLLNPPQDFSIEFWVHPDPAQPTAPQALIAAYEVDASGAMLSGFAVDLVPPPAGSTDYHARIRIGNGTPGSVPVAVDLVLGDGRDYGGWFHVVASYSSVDKQLKSYVNTVDGAPRDILGPSTGLPVYLLQNRSAPFRVGAGWSDQPGATPTLGRFFKGRIDEVALYRADLDGVAVTHHFLRGTSLPA